MDKLQPLIKHHFWIVFAFAVIFAVVGWWKANGVLAELTAARVAAVDSSFASAVKGGDAPNQSWITAATEINTSDRKKFSEASNLLWKRQKEVREFPAALRDELRGIKYMDPIPQLSTRRKWGAEYGKQFEDTLKIVQPFQYHNGSGQVIVDSSRVTHVEYNTWKLRPPTSGEIWKNQEDIWLLKSLLTSLARVNQGSTRLTESGLREIIQLQLRGGVRDAPLMAINAGGAGGASFSSSSDDDDDNMGSAPMSGAGAWAAFEAPFGFDFVSEEFGPLTGVRAGGGAVGFGGAGSVPELKRYVDDTDGMPYKTRAFFLNVRIRESDVPRLLAELTDSSFPVEIVRMDMNISGTSAGPTVSGFTGGGSLSGDDDEDEDRGAFGSMMMGPAAGGLPVPARPQQGLRAAMENLSPAARAKAQKDAQAAQQTVAAAMADPALIQVRVGGLMTLYQSKEEEEAQLSTEAAASQESGGTPAQPETPTDPASTDPASTDPASTDPASTDPASTDPAPTDPASTDPASTDPASTDPASTDPASTDPAPTDPASTDPASTDPASTDPASTDPASTDPAPTDPASTDPTAAEPSSVQPDEPPAKAEISP